MSPSPLLKLVILMLAPVLPSLKLLAVQSVASSMLAVALKLSGAEVGKLTVRDVPQSLASLTEIT